MRYGICGCSSARSNQPAIAAIYVGVLMQLLLCQVLAVLSFL